VRWAEEKMVERIENSLELIASFGARLKESECTLERERAHAQEGRIDAETAAVINIRRLDEQSLEFESDSLLSKSTDEIDRRNRQISDFEMGRLSTIVAGSATGSAADCEAERGTMTPGTSPHRKSVRASRPPMVSTLCLTDIAYL